MQLSAIGKIAHQCWHQIPEHFPFVILDEFVVMPNHIHGIIIIDKMDDDMHPAVQTQYFAAPNDIAPAHPNDMQNIALPNDTPAVQTQNIAAPNDIAPAHPNDMQNIALPNDTPVVQTQNIAAPNDIAPAHPNDMQNIALQNDTPAIQTQNIASLPPSILSSPPCNKFGPQSQNLPSIIRGFKIGVTKSGREINADFGWQPRYYDHIIRNQSAHERIVNYIKNNPENWTKDKFHQ